MDKKKITARLADWRNISEAECAEYLEEIGFNRKALYEDGLEWAQSIVFSQKFFRAYLEKRIIIDADGLPVMIKSPDEFIQEFITEYDLNSDIYENLTDDFFVFYFKYPKFKIAGNVNISAWTFSDGCLSLTPNFIIEFDKFKNDNTCCFLVTNLEYC